MYTKTYNIVYNFSKYNDIINSCISNNTMKARKGIFIAAIFVLHLELMSIAEYLLVF